MERRQQRGHQLENREFFESLYIVFNLGDVDALNRAICLRMPGELFDRCLAMSLQYSNGQFYKVIQLVKLLPPILCGIGTLSLQKVRR